MSMGDEDMKLKNNLNVYIAFHITNDLDRIVSTKDIMETMSKIYNDASCDQVFIDDEQGEIEQKFAKMPNELKSIEQAIERRKWEESKIQWESFKEKKHSRDGTEIIYKIQKPLMVSKETDTFFKNLQEVLSQLHEYYPHFTQIEEKANKGKGIE